MSWYPVASGKPVVTAFSDAVDVGSVLTPDAFGHLPGGTQRWHKEAQDRPVQARPPLWPHSGSPMSPLCLCGRRGHVGWVCFEQEQVDEGSEPGEPVMSIPQSWLGGMWRAEVVPFCPRFIPSPPGVSLSSQVDIWADTGLSRIWEQKVTWAEETIMAKQGSDTSRLRQLPVTVIAEPHPGD